MIIWVVQGGHKSCQEHLPKHVFPPFSLHSFSKAWLCSAHAHQFAHHLRLSLFSKRHGNASLRCGCHNLTHCIIITSLHPQARFANLEGIWSLTIPRTALLSLFSWIFMQVSGEVTYNGQPLSSFLPQKTAAYVPQVPFPLLHTQV